MIPIQPYGRRRPLHWVRAQAQVLEEAPDTEAPPEPSPATSPEPKPDPRAADSEWQSLVRFDPSGQDLLSLLEHFYQTEFYRSMIASKPVGGIPRRREAMLRRATDAMFASGQAIACKLLPVFDEWLAEHALTDPSAWAEARVVGGHGDWDWPDVFDRGDLAEAIHSMSHEWARYAVFGGDAHKQYDASRAYNFRPPAFDLPRDEDQLKEHYPTIYGILEDILEEYEEEQDEDEEYERGQMSVSDVLEFQSDMYGNDEQALAHLLENENEHDQLSALIEIQRNIVFPEWFRYWKAQGIDKTRENIERATDFLREACDNPRAFDPGRFSWMLNWAINISHQSGPMMDYVENRYSVSASDLEDLSQQDRPEWVANLRAMEVMARRHAVVVKVAGF